MSFPKVKLSWTLLLETEHVTIVAFGRCIPEQRIFFSSLLWANLVTWLKVRLFCVCVCLHCIKDEFKMQPKWAYTFFIHIVKLHIGVTSQHFYVISTIWGIFRTRWLLLCDLLLLTFHFTLWPFTCFLLIPVWCQV